MMDLLPPQPGAMASCRIQKLVLEPAVVYRDNLDVHDWSSVRTSLNKLFEMIPSLIVEVWTGIDTRKDRGGPYTMIRELHAAMTVHIPQASRIVYM